MQLIKQLNNGNNKVQLAVLVIGLIATVVTVTIIALTNHTFAVQLIHTLCGR